MSQVKVVIQNDESWCRMSKIEFKMANLES